MSARPRLSLGFRNPWASVNLWGGISCGVEYAGDDKGVLFEGLAVDAHDNEGSVEQGVWKLIVADIGESREGHEEMRARG
jgi:hypothetical protein